MPPPRPAAAASSTSTSTSPSVVPNRAGAVGNQSPSTYTLVLGTSTSLSVGGSGATTTSKSISASVSSSSSSAASAPSAAGGQPDAGPISGANGRCKTFGSGGVHAALAPLIAVWGRDVRDLDYVWRSEPPWVRVSRDSLNECQRGLRSPTRQPTSIPQNLWGQYSLVSTPTFT